MGARGGGGSAQSQGRGAPGSAGPGRSILARAPAALGPGRALPCARPRSSLSTRSSPGFPRVPRLPAGRAGALNLRAASRGRGGGPNWGGILLPLSLRRPPVASRSARLSPLGAGRGTSASLARAPSCARVEAAREAPSGRPPGPQIPGLSCARARADTPHLRPVHTCRRRRGRRRHRSSLAPPPRPPPALAAAAAAAAAGGRRREAAPRARCVSWALRLLPGAGRDPGLYTAAPLRSAGICCGGASSFFVWERLAESQESYGRERVPTCVSPSSPMRSPNPNLAKRTAEMPPRSDPCICRGLLKTWLVEWAPWCDCL